MIITSKNNKLIMELVKLKDTKEIKKQGMFLVEGAHLVKEAYNAKRLVKVLTLSPLGYKDVEEIIISKEVLEKLSFTKTPQGMIGLVKVEEPKEIDGNVLILDNIKDPGNLGTMIRTALAFNVKTIIASLETVYAYNDKVIRATQGAIFNISIIYASLIDEISRLKEKGYKVISTSLKANKYLSEVEKSSPFALVIGSEAQGVSGEVESACTDTIKIKMNDEMESLNAAIACAICLYELNGK